jgi:hypothetical protein
VLVAWVFFRASNSKDALYMISKLPGVLAELKMMFVSGTFSSGLALEKHKMTMCCMAILSMEMVHYLQRRHSISQLIDSKPIVVRWALYYAVVMIIMYFGVFASREFIYFQF